MLARRAEREELMDAADLPEADYVRVVHDLARVNTVTLARRPTLAFLARAVARLRQTQVVAAPPLRILDVGYGDGDMLRALRRWGRGRGVALDLVGIDLNPRSLAAAHGATPADAHIDFRVGDYQALAGQGWDLIVSSLVAHHMTRPQLLHFLRFMEREARVGWFVNDLHRHGFAWSGWPLLAGLARWHPIVRHDGHVSIARSFRPPEWRDLLSEAGITDARIARVFPFRLCVERFR